MHAAVNSETIHRFGNAALLSDRMCGKTSQFDWGDQKEIALNQKCWDTGRIREFNTP